MNWTLGYPWGLLLHYVCDAGTKLYFTHPLTGLMHLELPEALSTVSLGYRRRQNREALLWEALEDSLLIKLQPLPQVCSRFPTSSVQWKSAGS